MTDLPTSRLCSSKHRGRAGQAVALATAALVVGNGLRLRRHAKALPALAYSPASTEGPDGAAAPLPARFTG